MGHLQRDLAAASAFYTGKLGFSTMSDNVNRLRVPGAARKDEQILLRPLSSPTSRIFLLVPDLKKTKSELNQRKIAFLTGKAEVTVVDPDGNELVFKTDSKTL